MDTTAAITAPSAADFAGALAAGELELFYQPIYALPARLTLGAESLLRWRRGGEVLSPAVILPLAQEADLLPELTAWALSTAISECASWPTRRSALTVSVNVPAPLLTLALLDVVDEALAATGLPAPCLVIEVVESEAFTNEDEARLVMEHLSSWGVRLSADDFGTGLSTLDWIVSFPFDGLKLDRSLTRLLPSSPRARAAAKSALALASELSFSVVAEGVETPEEEALLAELGVRRCQGFLFSPPLPAESFSRLL